MHENKFLSNRVQTKFDIKPSKLKNCDYESYFKIFNTFGRFWICCKN